MKIAILTTDNREHYKEYANPIPHFGMAPEALLEGFQGLSDTEVHVLSCTQKPMKSPDKLADNIFFHSLYVPKIGWMRTSYQGCIRTIRRRLKTIQPDIVHGQGTERECAISAVFSKFPNLLTIHGNMAELARLFNAPLGSFGWLAGQLENICLKRTLGVFCNSEYTENLVKPRAPKTWRVPNPIRQIYFTPPKSAPLPGKTILLNIGVISDRKRQIELLDVAKRLHEQDLAFEIHFIGKMSATPYSTQFTEKLKEAEAKGYARYLGFKSTDELIACYDTAHGVIHFPSEEAFGLVVAEGLARNVKFFGARVGGIIDISSGVPDAKLFELEDWAGLESAIGKWIRAGAPRSSGAASVMSSRYLPGVIAQRHLEIYREVLKRDS